MSRMILALLFVTLALSADAASAQVQASARPEAQEGQGISRRKLSGPRFGFTVFTGDVADQRNQAGLVQSLPRMARRLPTRKRPRVRGRPEPELQQGLGRDNVVHAVRRRRHASLRTDVHTDQLRGERSRRGAANYGPDRLDRRLDPDRCAHTTGGVGQAGSRSPRRPCSSSRAPWQAGMTCAAVFGPDDRGGAMALWATMEMVGLR